MRYIIYTLFVLFISSLSAFSQSIQLDYSLSSDSALSLYNKDMHGEDDYIVGKEYKLYQKYKQGNPYLNSRRGKGTIYSNGYIYDKKVILYDIFKDEIAVNRTFKKSSNINVNIQKTRIDSFLIEFDNKKYLLKHIRINNSSNNLINDGFYEILHTGKYQLLLKHQKEKGHLNGITTYSYEISIFLKVGNEYFNIDSRKKLFELFFTNKKQLKKKYRLLRTPYNELSSSQLIDLIKYIETL